MPGQEGRRVARAEHADPRVVFGTGTGTGVGKTVVSAAIAALARRGAIRVAVLKPCQTGARAGEAGDVDEVARLAGPLTTCEPARYPEPLAPATAARRSGLPSVGPVRVTRALGELAAAHDLVLVEGAGGLLMRYDEAGHTLADTARMAIGVGSHIEVLFVAEPGLGTLKNTALTMEALRVRDLPVLGVVVGS